MSPLKIGALHTFSATMALTVGVLGVRYTIHGHVSWWFLLAILLWVVSFSMLSFLGGLEAGKR